MSSQATEANVDSRADDPLLVWAGTITGDLQLNFGDPADGALSATVTGGVSAPFELSLGERRVSVGRCRLTVSKPDLKARLISEYSLETKM
jgi:hypothetical protein